MAQVWNYYSYMWEKKQGFDSRHPSMRALESLPSVLRSDMAYLLPRSIILRSPFFEGLEEVLEH